MLADSLAISQAIQANKAQYFSGNELPEGADSLALVYCGHQFGQLNPQLGDGRAHLYGEVINNDNNRVDIQLKGSGPTPYSRQGDGRCALAPALREYIMSEAMFYLGVPTSRCLAVVATGEPVYRDTPKPGAVVTRVASSHLRVGTFQYFAIRNDLTSLQRLVDYAVERHFPQIEQAGPNKAIAFINAVMQKQIELVVEWMRVGFIHGVMNTDNTAISGETIDYGPCAMLGAYDLNTVYSSIDSHGRYAYGNQANIALWNMARFAEALLPLVDKDEKQAIALIEPMLMQFAPQFEQAYFSMLSNKLGLDGAEYDNRPLIKALLEKMQTQALDFTQTFTLLTQSLHDQHVAADLNTCLASWFEQWRARVTASEQSVGYANKLMRRNNPVVIPRNHHVEAVLHACEQSGDTQAVEDFLAVLRSPYEPTPATAQYQDLPIDGDQYYRTFCGT